MAQALTPAGLSQVINPAVRSGSLGQLGPGTIAVSEATAQGGASAMSTHGRSRELALMRLAGTTRRQAQHILLSELAPIAAVATALGTGAAWNSWAW